MDAGRQEGTREKRAKVPPRPLRNSSRSREGGEQRKVRGVPRRGTNGPRPRKRCKQRARAGAFPSAVLVFYVCSVAGATAAAAVTVVVYERATRRKRLKGIYIALRNVTTIGVCVLGGFVRLYFFVS